MDRRSSTRGFTLAELLIVVAIIAVLVAIAIPVFNNQLEKSREATDLANVRSAYAEVMTAAITEDKTATYDGQVMYDSATGLYTAVVSPLAQKQDDWTTSLPITIGGVSSDDTEHWHGAPAAGGKCTITYGPDNAVTINWGDGSSGGGGGNTPAKPGGSVADKFGNVAINWPDGAFKGSVGQIYKYEGKVYICLSDQNFDAGGRPTQGGWYEYNFVEVKDNATVYTKPNYTSEWGQSSMKDLKAGDLYYDGKNYYIMKTNSDWYTVPPADNWIKINYN